MSTITVSTFSSVVESTNLVRWIILWIDAFRSTSSLKLLPYASPLCFFLLGVSPVLPLIVWIGIAEDIAMSIARTGGVAPCSSIPRTAISPLRRWRLIHLCNWLNRVSCLQDPRHVHQLLCGKRFNNDSQYALSFARGGSNTPAWFSITTHHS